ncbi:MAG: hypothetical protein II852_18545 [Bacteroidales bacterium]|nr:hypothetical protein [Bacteroidales bacterium]
MGKFLFIAEKPSVAQEFAKALKDTHTKYNGYLEGQKTVVTWCVGHLVTMSYPEVYNPDLKRWREESLPFIPEKFLYEIIPNVQKQFDVVKELLLREDVDCIYVCTDSGREGEYIYRLVDMMANVPAEKPRKRVWIDSQTEEEIRRGIREAKPLDAYNNLSDAAYLRAKEDYLMGINFSRILTIKYGNMLKSHLKLDKNAVVSVGRVMTCVLGMVVRREREIRKFKKTAFYRIMGKFTVGDGAIDGEWRAVEGSAYFNSPKLYKENGFKEKADAEKLIQDLQATSMTATVETIEKRKKRRIRRCFSTSPNCRTSAQNCSRFRPTKLCRLCRICMRKNSLHTRVQMRVCCRRRCLRKSPKIFMAWRRAPNISIISKI